MTADDLAIVVKGIAPVLREYVAAHVDGLKAQIAALEQRLVAAPAIDLEHVARQAAALVPAPKDGRDGTSVSIADLEGAIAQACQKAVADRPAPRDGVGVLSALVDRTGHLVITLSDGSMKDLGTVVGQDVDMAAVDRIIREAVDRFPKPTDGKDGLGFDDLSVTHDGERLFTFTFARGDQVKVFPFTLPIPIYRGVFAEGTSYGVHDVVTWGGAMWIAKMETATRPSLAVDAATREWQMCVKEGRKGKDGKDGEPGPAGKAVLLPAPVYGIDGRKL